MTAQLPPTARPNNAARLGRSQTAATEEANCGSHSLEGGLAVVAQNIPGMYDFAVSLAEIKQLATQLPPEELTALTAFLVKRDQSSWDDQLDKDAASGKLDRLFEEA